MDYSDDETNRRNNWLNTTADGFLVLENFKSAEECDRLRERARELVAEFDPADYISIFSTHEQTRTSDEYFLGLGRPDPLLLRGRRLRRGRRACARRRSARSTRSATRCTTSTRCSSASRATRQLAALAAELGLRRAAARCSRCTSSSSRYIGGEVQLPPGPDVPLHRAASVTGLWFALEDATHRERLPVGAPRRPPARPQVALRPRAGRRHALRALDADARGPRTDSCRSKSKKGTLMVLDGLLPAHEPRQPLAEARATPTRCTSSTASASTRATTGCSALLRCRCGDSNK